MATEKPEIVYDEVDFDSAIDDFGDETVQFCVKAFIDKTYSELKSLLPSLYKAQNYKDIRGKMHILKTNSGYMGANNFQSLCKEFETCCKFESLNEQRIDELYPIFMTNLDKLYKKLKKLYAEKFESEIKEEVELENKKDEEENNNKNNNQENIESQNKTEEKKEEDNNNIIKEEKEIENNENKNNIEKEESKIEQDNNINIENIENIENVEKSENKLNEIIKTEKKDEKNSEDNYNNIIIKKNPIKKNLSLQQSKITNIKLNINMMNISNQKITSTINENEKSNVSSENSININDIIKPRNFSSKNVLDLISLKEGDSQKYHQNQFYKNIFQSFNLTEEESKNKNVPKKVQFSPKYIPESQKNKIINRLKLGFSTMDKNDIRDSLTRYDLAVLKNSATLVKENLIKFLDEELPKIKDDFNKILESHDLSKKKEVIEKINVIINYMKYLTDSYNKFFFRMIEKIEICIDSKSFKSILDKLIDKLKLLEQELTVIYRVKIKRDNSLLKSMGYFQNDINKNSKKNLPVDMHNNYNTIRNRENNYEQIEGLKKNLGIYNNNPLKNKNSKKKLIHFPYSFKIQSLFYIEEKKNIHTNFDINSTNIEKKENKKEEDKENNDENQDKNNKEEEFDFIKDSQTCLNKFKDAIIKKNLDYLIQAINDFKLNLVEKYFFTGLDQLIEKWISKVKKSENFEDLNAYIADIEDIIDYMKSELENKNIGIDNEEEESQEDEDIINEEKQKKIDEENLDKEDVALFSQLKKFNTEAFFLPRNPAFSQHKFKMKVEKIIRETNQNTQEVIQNNYNSNYNFVDKTSSHIILSQNFRTKKNKLIGFSYPFKEDTFLNNCIII